jgi:hypothetical protein
MRSHLAFWMGLCSFALACSSQEQREPGEGVDAFVFDTGTFSVNPADESYQCFTHTLDRDLSVDRIWYEGRATVHHLVLVQTLVPEPEAPFQCDTFFKPTWLPLFANGTGSAALDLPSGSSFFLPKGTQLLVQLHLLNSSGATKQDSVQIRLRRVAPTEDRAGIYGFGTTKISLPPNQKSSVQNDCSVESQVDVFAVFPHMHTRGTSLSFAVGRDEASLAELYRVEPWDFDQQAIAPLSFRLEPGDLTRVTCNYDNPTSELIEFGESTFNEMCFFTTFRSKYQALDGCIDLGGWGSNTPGGDGGTGDGGGGSCEPSANEIGVGGPCSAGGGECASGLSCSSDLEQTSEPGFCMKLGCKTSGECGSNAVCCAPAEAGGVINVCLPASCQPTDCAKVD